MEFTSYHFEKIDSTNNWAKAHLHKLNPNALTIITASEQTQGRGRYDKTWISPSNQNLLLTFCFTTENPEFLAQLTALSCAKTLESLSLSPKIKWPNDILIHNKKICGILTEIKDNWAIIGIGLNVNMPQETADQINQPATSLLIETGKHSDLSEIQQTLLQQFIKDLTLYKEKGFDPFISELKKYT